MVGDIGRAKLRSWRQFSPSKASNVQSLKRSAQQLEILVEARTTLATQSYDFDEARLRSRNAAIALEASHAAFAALEAETDRLRASRHHHSK